MTGIKLHAYEEQHKNPERYEGWTNAELCLMGVCNSRRPIRVESSEQLKKAIWDLWQEKNAEIQRLKILLEDSSK